MCTTRRIQLSRFLLPLLLSLLVSLLGVGAAGCFAGSYRIGAGPTMDTEGRIGGEVFAGVSFGIAPEEGLAIGPELDGAVGGTAAPAGGLTRSYAAGLSLVLLGHGEEDVVGFRIGLGGQELAIEQQPFAGPYLGLSLMYPLRYSGDDHKALGLHLQSSILVRQDEGPGPELLGRFRFGVVFEHHLIHDEFHVL